MTRFSFQIRSLLLLLMLLFFSNSYSGGIRSEFKSVAALGFFPFGGNASFNEQQLSTYFLGWHNAMPFTDKIELSLGTYLLGLNYSALQPESSAQFINFGMLRFGPSYRSDGREKDGRFAFGAQFGYAMLLLSDVTNARTKYQHGLEISFTFSWSRKDSY